MSEVAATKCKIYQSTRVRLNNLQIRAPVRHCEEPPPGPTGRCLRPHLYDTRQLDVWGRRVAGHPTSGDRRNVRMTARLRTKEGVISSSSSSSSVILTSRRRFGAWLLFAGSASAGDGSATSGLFPATLSSVVEAGRFCSSSLLVY